MNPDSPYHFIKKEFIDKAAEKGYRRWTFGLDDNLSLTEQYKQELKNAYTGLWYMRMVDGLWVLAQGAIYGDCWDEVENSFDDEDMPPGLLSSARRYIPIDYGTLNPMVFGRLRRRGDLLGVPRILLGRPGKAGA